MRRRLAPLCAATIAATLLAMPAASAQDLGRRVIAVRAPGVAARPGVPVPGEELRDYGTGFAEPRHYLHVDHPLYRLYLRRLEQVGRWDLDPVAAPEGLNTGGLLGFLRNARDRYGGKLETLVSKPDRTFRFRGETIRAGTIGRLLRASFFFDPRWTVGPFEKGMVGLRLANRIYDVETGLRVAEQVEQSTVPVTIAGLPESVTAAEAASFERGLDGQGRQELQLGREAFPAGSPQIQQAIGQRALTAADQLARKAIERTGSLDAFKLRGLVTGLPPEGVRLGMGLDAGVAPDSTFWVLKRSRRDGRTVENAIGFVKVRDVSRNESLAQPIAGGDSFSTGDALALAPQLGLSASARALVNPLAFAPPADVTFRQVTMTSPGRFPVPLIVSLPIEFNLGSVARTPLLSETCFFLEPGFGLRGADQDIFGLAGVKRRLYFGQLALTPGVKAGVTFATRNFGTLDASSSLSMVTTGAGAGGSADSLDKDTAISGTRLGLSLGPELSVDYLLHPAFSAGLFVDFLYTMALGAPTYRARDYGPIEDTNFDSDPAPNPLQTMRLGTGLHATLLF